MAWSRNRKVCGSVKSSGPRVVGETEVAVEMVIMRSGRLLGVSVGEPSHGSRSTISVIVSRY